MEFPCYLSFISFGDDGRVMDVRLDTSLSWWVLHYGTGAGMIRWKDVCV